MYIVEIKNFTDLSFEIRRIRHIIAEERDQEIETIYQNLIKALKVRRDQVEHYETISIYSRLCSYQVLSIYLLLDLIDRFWDGEHFLKKQDRKTYFLYEELSTKDEGDTCNLHAFEDPLYRASEVIDENLFIFLLPYQNDRDYTLREALQGHILIIYAGNPDKVKQAFYEGLSEFYLKVTLGGSLPKWAKSKREFRKEFTKFCKGEENKYKNM